MGVGMKAAALLGTELPALSQAMHNIPKNQLLRLLNEHDLNLQLLP